MAFAVSDSTLKIFRNGVVAYDSVLIKQAYFRAEQEHPRGEFLFKATCLWRIQVIKFVDGDTKGVAQYGARALDLLDSAQKNAEAPYFIQARSAYVCQLLAGLGITNGATYGPRTARHLNEMKKLKPRGYETRFIDAANLLDMPVFVGGNPAKALELLRALYDDFPDSMDVAKIMARAYRKNKRINEARALLDMVLRANPRDLWAIKEIKELRR
jgi:hypothetical protein